MKLKRFIFFVLFVLIIEMGILFGISLYFNTNLANTIFVGSFIIVIFAFLMNSTGDVLSKSSQLSIAHMFSGAYKPEQEEASININPFLIGTLLCFILYFPLYYLGVLS